MNVINTGLFTYCKLCLMSAFSIEDSNSVCLRHSCIPRTHQSALHVISTQRMETATSADQMSILGYLGQLGWVNISSG